MKQLFKKLQLFSAYLAPSSQPLPEVRGLLSHHPGPLILVLCVKR